MAAFTAIYDACVLYPAPLRDLLMQLAVTDLFRARWTEAIHDEWIEAVCRSRPELAPHLARTRALMNAHVRDCLVTGYEDLIPGLKLPDGDDRHVLAAAIRCGADSIVTFNLKDFPADYLAAFGVEAVHPDDFIADQIDLSAATVCDAVKRIRGRLKNPPRSIDEYLGTLDEQGLVETVSRLRDFSPLL